MNLHIYHLSRCVIKLYIILHHTAQRKTNKLMSSFLSEETSCPKQLCVCVCYDTVPLRRLHELDITHITQSLCRVGNYNSIGLNRLLYTFDQVLFFQIELTCMHNLYIFPQLIQFCQTCQCFFKTFRLSPGPNKCMRKNYNWRCS